MPLAIRVVDRIQDQSDFTVLSALAAGDQLLYSGSAFRNYAGTGATLPATAVIGQWFMHTPTGRTNLMIYDGSAWVPARSMGTWTVYVDGASGSDSQDNGGSAGSGAFATIQYAIDQIAGVFSGNITINVAAGTYAETVTIQGKNPTGNYSITIQGALTTTASFTATGGTQGSGASAGTVTYGSFGAWAGQRLKGTSGSNNGAYRIIDSIAGSTATIVGYWSAAPTGSDTFDVVTPACTVNQVNVGIGQSSQININDLAFAYTDSNVFNTPVNNTGRAAWNRCNCIFSVGSNLSFAQNATVVMTDCYLEKTRLRPTRAYLAFTRCKSYKGHLSTSTGMSVQAINQSTVDMLSQMSVFDGGSLGTRAIKLEDGSNFQGNSIYTAIRNFAGGGTGYGIYADTTSVGANTGNHQYASNDTNEYANATAFAYID